jgi:OOP family OmpA-OmpF porin
MELNMNKKLLSIAVLGALSMAQSVMAQDYDDRWYITAGTGVNYFDKDRRANEDVYGSLGFGRFFSPNWSFDAEFTHVDPSLKSPHGTSDNNGRNWELASISLVTRYHFIKEGRSWNPYLSLGLGSQRHHDGTQTQPIALGFNPSRVGDNMLTTLGVGFQANTEHVSYRGEAGIRYDWDDGGTRTDGGSDHQLEDLYFGLTLLVPLGAKAAPPPPPPPPAAPPPEKTCADMDDDGDGVNNCNDKCPTSEAGQAIGPDGCPVPLTIDLKGVNFDFDKSTLRPDAVAILDEAVSILGKYPQLKVEVAGHTDSIGTEEYNQGLSERRAHAVYDYLTGHGIDAGRLVGPTGYGESKPIAPNTNPDGSDNPEGRAQNRRTELNVQN